MTTDIYDSRILIVDDAPENIELLASILSEYKISAAPNGQKALNFVSGKIKPDLILLDIVMPEMSGFDVCAKMKENPSSRDIPVIFITSRTDVEDETRGLELGAVDFIPKPISPPVVLARVKKHLELSRAHELLALQNKELEERNKFITDSIRYAQKIQSAMLPTYSEVQRIFPESFLIHKPKDILSGDFFWAREVDSCKVIAAVDCTGHGVPGSLLSMLGNTLLNEIIFAQKLLDPGKILNELDRRVITELNKDVHADALDGMDVCLCVIDSVARKVRFSGAVRPLYYISGGNFGEIDGVRKSIGENGNGRKFETIEIDIKDDIVLYLTTDGFGDQNNPDGTKFSTKKVKASLMNISSLSLQEQGIALLHELEQHTGNETQRDDITFIGVKI